ncbi:MAG TPA: arginine--tRNA ligase, partial [Sutterella sp.]|nr:arginine--tRNA ligase [Sutterella sp.]
NPTGPLHLGHARQGVLGDVLAGVFKARGFDVVREFYYNDAGVQIDTLTQSVRARALEIQGIAEPFPENGYKGDYIRDIAESFLARQTVRTRDGIDVTASGNVEDTANLRAYSVTYLQNEQDADLKALGIAFDNFYLESSLYTDGLVEEAVAACVKSGATYEKEGALWLKTTDFPGIADDKDRVMRKSDGHYTYFVPDIAYHLRKFTRGFTQAIDIQGSDHHGTTARVRIGVQLAGRVLGLDIPCPYPHYILHKMLKVVRDGEEVKMSKRAGTYVTLRDLVNWVGRDAARYFLVSRKADTEFVFDVNLALSRSDDNPVFYLQYAHARIESIFRQAKESGIDTDRARLAAADLSLLSQSSEQNLIVRLSQYPATLEQCVRDETPHLLCIYLKDLAAGFHAFYNTQRVLTEDAELTTSRLALLEAVRIVLRNGFALLGIEAPERM